MNKSSTISGWILVGTTAIRWRDSFASRTAGMTVYVRIRDGKFWIEEDWTEDGIANDLVRAGVPKEDIVLAFHEPKMRQYTDFALAW